jgi:hypothetical protein
VIGRGPRGREGSGIWRKRADAGERRATAGRLTRVRVQLATVCYGIQGTMRIAAPCHSPWSHASDIGQVWAPQLFYTLFYNHARRLRLEKLIWP